VSAMRAVCMDCTATRLCLKHRAEKDSQVQADMGVAQEAIRKAKELGFKWEEPEEARGPGKALGRVLAPVFDVLRSRPNEWALIRTYGARSGSSNAVRVLKRQIHRIPGRWEFASRVDEKGSRLYARYLGPDEAPS
jgi:hypothetical protein